MANSQILRITQARIAGFMFVCMYVYGRTQYFKTEMELGPLSNWHTDSTAQIQIKIQLGNS